MQDAEKAEKDFPSKGFPLPAKFRIKRRACFSKVFSEPVVVWKSRYFAMLAKPSDGYGRIGLIVAKSRFKKAVQRNALKRRVREIFRCNRTHAKGLDIVIVVKEQFDKHALSKLADRFRTLRNCK